MRIAPLNYQNVPLRTWPKPEDGMYTDPRAEAIWQAIQDWDIAVPGAYRGYCSATGSHVKAILDALRAVK